MLKWSVTGKNTLHVVILSHLKQDIFNGRENFFDQAFIILFSIFAQIKEEIEKLGELKKKLGDDQGSQKFVLKTPKVNLSCSHVLISVLIIVLALIWVASCTYALTMCCNTYMERRFSEAKGHHCWTFKVTPKITACPPVFLGHLGVSWMWNATCNVPHGTLNFLDTLY